MPQKGKRNNPKKLEGGTANYWGDDINDDDEWAKRANELLAKKSKLKAIIYAIKKCKSK